MARVLVVGGINQDVTVRADHRAGDGETVLGVGPVWSAGGKGANMAAAAARAGAEVSLCGAVGTDAAGEGQLAELRRAGVDVSHVRIDPHEPTGVALIVVTPDGQNSIVVGPGANATLAVADLDRAVADGAGVVVAQAEVSGAVTDLVAAAVRRTGARLVLSLAPVTPVAAATLQAADPLVVNEEEAREVATLVGITEEYDDRHLAARLVASAGCRSVVMTLGSRGAIVATHDATVHVPSPEVRVVDTTGAGDLMAGVLAARLAGGHDLVAATREACGAAAESVRHHGARMPLS